MTDTWTLSDEARLQELLARKSAFESLHVGALRDFCDQHFYSGIFPSEIACELRNNADTVRDLLLPFDSGVRSTVET